MANADMMVVEVVVLKRITSWWSRMDWTVRPAGAVVFLVTTNQVMGFEDL